jgi:DNA-binding response OmpR family regulator
MATPFKLLVVEDDAVLRDLYIRKFSKDAYEVITATNGQEALDYIARNTPDVLLLDLNMPVLDGFGVLEKLPKEKRTFPIIIITNFDDQTNRERGKSLGVSDFFVKKDMTIKTLVEMVDKLLKK